MGEQPESSPHLTCGGGLPAKHGLCSTSSIAAPPLPLPPPPHKHPGANGERPDGERFTVIYLLIRKHKFAFLFNWLRDLWEFDCRRNTALIG